MIMGKPYSLRQLHNLIPKLVKASMVNQALKLEKALASTFELSDEMQDLFASLPQNYLEAATDAYQQNLYTAYDLGSKLDAVKLKEISKEELDDLNLKAPLPYTWEQDLLMRFRREAESYLDSLGDKKKNMISEQLKKDLSEAYTEGVREALRLMNQQEQEQEQDNVTDEMSEKSAEDKEPATAAQTNEIINKLEQYTKLLKNPQAEKVLRYELGLPVRASVEQDEIIGSYTVTKLRDKISSMLDNTEEHFLVDHITSEKTPAVILEKLGLQEAVADVNNLSLQETLIAADYLAEELTAALDLPGQVMFVDTEDSLYLAFNKDKPEVTAKRKKDKGLPSGEMGALSLSSSNEIKALASMKMKGATLKDLKKNAPAAAKYISDAMKEARYSKIPLEDLAKACINTERLVESVYKNDGLQYYRKIKGK